MTLEVIHADNHVLVVIKPAGLLSQGDVTGDPCALEQARAWIKREYDKPGNVFCGLVHRLDRPVEGVMVFARTSKAASRLSDQLRKRTVEKVYRALVHGRPQPQARLVDTLDGKRCELDYTLLETANGRSLLEVRPLTGRKHQIRRQLSMARCPIVGDLRYGARAPLPNKAIALYAYRLAFDHPTRSERCTFTCPQPRWWPV